MSILQRWGFWLVVAIVSWGLIGAVPIGHAQPADGNGAYDFDFDPASQTLALLDFTNRNVHVFSVGSGSAFDEVARFNVDSTANAENPEFIGSNPGAVAFSGTQLYVGGFNNSGGNATVSVVEVLGATATGIVNLPSYSAPIFSKELTPSFRGFASLDVSGDGATLGIAYDDGQPPSPLFPGFAAYNTGDNTESWAVEGRGSSGVAFDPGFQGAGGAGAGTAFGQFGSGRRLLYNTANGNQLFDNTDGMIWYGDVGGTFIRDLDFDPDTGDIYVRHGNQVSKATRVGDNATMDPGIIVSEPPADFVGIQNLSFLSNTASGDLIIYNDREIAGTDQPFADVIKVVDATGAPVAATFTFLSEPPTCDFNGDGACDITDLDDLTMEISAGGMDLQFDLNGDGAVNLADVDEWLVQGGALNLPSGNPYLVGDTNLDGSVDVSDFNNWNGAKFTMTGKWSLGDFNADGSSDVSDFNAWNGNKFQTADAALASVPEPAALFTALLGLAGLWSLGRRRAILASSS